MVCTVCGEVVAKEIAQDVIANYVQHRLIKHHIGNDLAAGIGQGVGALAVVWGFSKVGPSLKRYL